MLHRVCYMPVLVECKRGCVVSQITLYSLDIVPGTKGRYCIGMTEIMKASAFRANTDIYLF